jgi:hypothetical protein
MIYFNRLLARIQEKSLEKYKDFFLMSFKNRVQFSLAGFFFALPVSLLLHLAMRSVVTLPIVVAMYGFVVLLSLLTALVLLVPAVRRYFFLMIFTLTLSYVAAIITLSSGAKKSGPTLESLGLDPFTIVICLSVIFFTSMGTWLTNKVVAAQAISKMQSDAELSVAAAIQRQLVPERSVKETPFEFYGLSVPASAAGGDYFDVVRVSDTRLVMVIGDVSGHGVGAGILMAMVKSSFRTLMENFSTPETLLMQMNQFVCENSDKRTFVSFACVVLDAATSTAVLTNAGHLPVLYYQAATGKANYILWPVPSLALGLSRKATFNSFSVPLAEGDAFLLYTDGVTEAVNAAGNAFGETGLQTAFADAARKSSRQTVEMVSKSLSAFTGRTAAGDDQTVVCFHFRSA